MTAVEYGVISPRLRGGGVVLSFKKDSAPGLSLPNIPGISPTPFFFFFFKFGPGVESQLIPTSMAGLSLSQALFLYLSRKGLVKPRLASNSLYS